MLDSMYTQFVPYSGCSPAVITGDYSLYNGSLNY